MTKMELLVYVLNFILMIAGCLLVMWGEILYGVYANSLVIALQSVLISQEVKLRNRKG